MSASRRRPAKVIPEATEASARPRRWSHAVRRIAALLWLLAGCAMSVASAQSRAEHGSSDVYTAPGIGIVWAIERGASDADAVVVLRIATDAATYPWCTVRGVNPFNHADELLLPPTAVERSIDVRIPRARFADHPRTEVAFFATEAAARSGAASMTVFYLGVPDTTPEFVDAAKLDASLSARMALARAAKGAQ